MPKSVAQPTERVVTYPFIKAPVTLMDEEGPYTTMSWRPGTLEPKRGEYTYPEHCPEHYRIAHGEGHMLLQFVKKVEMPKPYRVRVFYVRRWRDPDGKEFGKRTLRVCTFRAWAALASGYRFPYKVQPYHGDTTPEERAAIGRPWAPLATRPVQVGTLEEGNNITKIICRRCAVCAHSTHHWLPNPRESDIDPNAPNFAPYSCKHCPARGTECEQCLAEGCATCKHEGVLFVCWDDDYCDADLSWEGGAACQ